jgi:hypothetical protein
MSAVASEYDTLNFCRTNRHRHIALILVRGLESGTSLAEAYIFPHAAPHILLQNLTPGERHGKKAIKPIRSRQLAERKKEFAVWKPLSGFDHQVLNGPSPAVEENVFNRAKLSVLG